MSTETIEESPLFQPRYNDQGLIPCITIDDKSGDILMFAWMNKDALEHTINSGEVHYWSRSRGALWHKGATSGHVQHVVEMRTDCDQDCLMIRVRVESDPVVACHTGRKSCFYRVVEKDGKALRFTE